MRRNLLFCFSKSFCLRGTAEEIREFGKEAFDISQSRTLRLRLWNPNFLNDDKLENLWMKTNSRLEELENQLVLACNDGSSLEIWVVGMLFVTLFCRSKFHSERIQQPSIDFVVDLFILPDFGSFVDILATKSNLSMVSIESSLGDITFSDLLKHADEQATEIYSRSTSAFVINV